MAGSAARSRRQRKKTKHYTDDDPSTFTTKEKKGERRAAVVRTPSPIAAVVAKKRPRPKRAHAPVIPRPNVSLSHHIRLLPLFTAKESQHSVINGRGLGIPPPLKKLEWTQMTSPLSFIPDEPPRPSSCTCLASDSRYLAMGDAAGFLSIFTLYPTLSCVSRLATSASARETQTELKLPQAKKFGLYQKKTHPNKVEKLALAGDRVVLATKDEIEMLDVRRNKIIWSLPIDIPVHHLDIHPETHQVLVSFTFSSENRAESSSPLWLVGVHAHAATEGEKSAVLKTLVHPHSKDGGVQMSLGNRCAAIWDKSNFDHIMMVALIKNNDGSIDQELLCLDKSTFVVLQQAPVPNKPVGKSSNHTVEHLSQSPSGYLTLVSSTKGIRLIETSTFNLLRVFGDSVSLHGHSLLFQQCCFVRKPTLESEVDDLLIARQHETMTEDKDWMEHDSAWILGVPFCNREPRELRDTLHLWDLCEGKHTYTTLMAPPKAEGFVSVQQKSDSLIVTTQSGSCFTMSTSVKSDFPGIMYPPGYQVINDNLEYIEDEDDLDVVVTELQIDQEDDEDDDEDQIAEALRLSMLQSQEDVDVASCDDTKPFVLPCHPEAYLKQVLKEGLALMSVDAEDYFQRTSFSSAVLLPMPHTRSAILAKQEKPLEEPKPIISKAIRAKRSKAASLEAMLKSSLNPDLRRIMISRQLWATGGGSRYLPFAGRTEGNTSRNGQRNGSDRTSFIKRQLVGLPVVSSYEESAASRSAVPHSSGGDFVVVTQSHFLDYSKDEVANNTVCPNSGDAGKATKGIACNLEISIGMSNGAEVEKGKLDAAAALLMSACGELESPHFKRCEITARAFDDFEASRGIVEKSSRTESPVAMPISICRACRGRWVFHTCGKKAKPVDYDEIMKAEEERKEKEEEEKRKARAEKRRLADARRREARKKKKLEEEARIRRDEAARIRWEQTKRQEDLERSRLHSEDKDRRRADMLQRLQAEQASTISSTTDWPQTVQSVAASPAPYSHQDWPAPSHGFQSPHEIPRQSDWPQPAHTDSQEPAQTYSQEPAQTYSQEPAQTYSEYMVSVEVPKQTSKYSADWPPQQSQIIEQGKILGSSSQASTGREWPDLAQTYTVDATKSSSYSSGISRRMGTYELGQEHRDESLPRSSYVYASPAATNLKADVGDTRSAPSFHGEPPRSTLSESKDDVSAIDANYPSDYHKSSKRLEAPKDLSLCDTNIHSHYPSSYYGPTSAHGSETIDPAEALASLAMFATAAPMANVSGNPSSQSRYKQDSQQFNDSNALSKISNGWVIGETQKTPNHQYGNQM